MSGQTDASHGAHDTANSTADVGDASPTSEGLETVEAAITGTSSPADGINSGNMPAGGLQKAAELVALPARASAEAASEAAMLNDNSQTAAEKAGVSTAAESTGTITVMSAALGSSAPDVESSKVTSDEPYPLQHELYPDASPPMASSAHLADVNVDLGLSSETSNSAIVVARTAAAPTSLSSSKAVADGGAAADAAVGQTKPTTSSPQPGQGNSEQSLATTDAAASSSAAKVTIATEDSAAHPAAPESAAEDPKHVHGKRHQDSRLADTRSMHVGGVEGKGAIHRLQDLPKDTSKSTATLPNPYLQNSKQLLTSAADGTTPPETVHGLVCTHAHVPAASKQQGQPQPQAQASHTGVASSKASQHRLNKAAITPTVPKLNTCNIKAAGTCSSTGPDSSSSSSRRVKTAAAALKSPAGSTSDAAGAQVKGTGLPKPWGSSGSSRPGRLAAPAAAVSAPGSTNSKTTLRSSTAAATHAAKPASKAAPSSARAAGSLSARASGSSTTTAATSSRIAIPICSKDIKVTSSTTCTARTPATSRAHGANTSMPGETASGRARDVNLSTTGLSSSSGSSSGGLTELGVLMNLSPGDAARVSRTLAFFTTEFHKAIKDTLSKCESKPEELLPHAWQAYQDAWEAERKLRFPEYAALWSPGQPPAADPPAQPSKV